MYIALWNFVIVLALLHGTDSKFLIIIIIFLKFCLFVLVHSVYPSQWSYEPGKEIANMIKNNLRTEY